ncbi:hypothetical protein [Rickettsia prowazekii]|uniref:Uncharacterized protein n=2 Tax=Rickettsia prowazekii TaxID=782 RepID=Q9ZDV1_RICPR|nr:hypothetical protein [Rickettsia prowazekii]ADE29735.1 hypothetical protein rpr22_CDS218 [Rickettsia prowazekii str. Rp22]AFE49043.1 hypothetical protein M9W_01090 [Rickettsia prowazekii str. Chernikova]AFE50733.1 hypothetical protein MA1_01085 [Rickettsia prowazekii str. BuV67-CWPP]AFE51573.1 hypothetical protein MA3_01100 [Rickettsia prowazekii str. Dachau]AMS12143.1 hypothetical protein AR462_01135 [Rickettsia prowazekii]
MYIMNFSSFHGLNTEQQTTLKRLLIKLGSFTKSLKINVTDLENHLFYIVQNSLDELLHTENIDTEKITTFFNITLQESLNILSRELDRTYQEQLEKKDIFLFDGVIIEKCLNVLEQVLKFQKELDTLYPRASHKIIKSLENIIVMVIASQIPILGIFIQISETLKKVNNLIDYKKLLPKITRFHNEITEIIRDVTSNKQLKNIFKKATKVATILEISKESARKVIEIANKNPNNSASFENVVKAAKTIPKSKDEVEEKIAELKSNIESTIPKNINIDKLNSINNTISYHINETKTELLKVLNPEASFAEKIESLCKAAAKAMTIVGHIKEILGVVPGSKQLGTVISLAIKSNLLPPPVFTITKLAPDITKLVNIGKAVVIMLSKIHNLTQQHGRANSV